MRDQLSFDGQQITRVCTRRQFVHSASLFVTSHTRSVRYMYVEAQPPPVGYAPGGNSCTVQLCSLHLPNLQQQSKTFRRIGREGPGGFQRGTASRAAARVTPLAGSLVPFLPEQERYAPGRVGLHRQAIRAQCVCIRYFPYPLGNAPSPKSPPHQASLKRVLQSAANPKYLCLPGASIPQQTGG